MSAAASSSLDCICTDMLRVAIACCIAGAAGANECIAIESCASIFY